MEEKHLVDHMSAKGLKIFLSFLILGFAFFGVFDYVISSAELFSVTMKIEKSDNLMPNEKVVIHFSNTVNTKNVENIIKIEPKAEVRYNWINENKTLEVLPKKNWKNNESYQVSIVDARSSLGLKFSAKEDFTIEQLPSVISIFPTKAEKNVIIDIEDPIILNFSKNLDGYNTKITINPTGNFLFETNSDKNSIRIMPQEKLESGKRYDVYVELKPSKAADNKFERIFDSFFETKQIEIKEWSKDISVRLFQAKNYTTPKVLEGKYIDINLKSQVMVLFENGRPIDSYLVSSGKAGMNTPQGSFQIYNKFPRPWSGKYGLYMPHWMAITSSGAYGIHELPEWPSGYKEGANHLGIPVSHGCVRLGVGPAERVYNWAEIGTPVNTHY